MFGPITVPFGAKMLFNTVTLKPGITFEDIERDCTGGPFTLLFRDVGIAFAYGFAMLVLEPVLGRGLNKIFDYFYTPADDNSSGVEIEEIDEDGQ